MWQLESLESEKGRNSFNLSLMLQNQKCFEEFYIFGSPGEKVVVEESPCRPWTGTKIGVRLTGRAAITLWRTC